MATNPNADADDLPGGYGLPMSARPDYLSIGKR